MKNWQRPEGPAKVGIQVGHWKNDEVPEELHKLKANTGSTGGGKWEWEVNHKIATKIAEILAAEGVAAEILPTTVPPKYWADVFIAIHADGSDDKSKSGYKFAGPWRDYTKKSQDLVSILEKHYEEATGLARDENISRNMRGYYAFSWWRYEHAVHPMTTAVIAETGFLTNRNDQKLLIGSPEVSAEALADGILEYLQKEGLLTSTS
jgi:N-acetylmuramoyl-L-alanine amidase